MGEQKLEDHPAWDAFHMWRKSLDTDLGDTWDDQEPWWESFSAGWNACADLTQKIIREHKT